MNLPTPRQPHHTRRVLHTNRLYVYAGCDMVGATAIVLRPFGFFVRTSGDGDLPMTETIDLASIKESELSRIGCNIHIIEFIEFIEFKIDQDDHIRCVDVEPIATSKTHIVDGVFLSHLSPVEIGE